MSWACLSPLVSRLSHLFDSSSWSDQCRSAQGRAKNTFRRNKINLRPFKPKHRISTQRHDAKNPVPRQQANMIYTTRYGSCRITDSGSADVISSQVIPVSVDVLTMPRYVDRACQTDLRPTSALSTYDLVSADILDECTIPDGRQPPPPPPPPPYALRQDPKV
ncbi:uncharacterized protein B0J16DRAFT_273842 [Fusarium flagelliforme]|uniref:uncharacterized protein n=1 Tax=Fusarium flagelliforme TaxID=2675880 RepID=UPI001E8E9D6B|nr:uncharacterized protein B0J16DRAFT_359208 [Fusarium flagelliforme]XP_045979522.1 uncharacterized protein B0J16DRAFT_273842 [Fusarium flagelliforme]KAH7169616.1 hypothetical protein B0J16DRAFT_359208 [Fusarium flagelliforme]KAH7175182.1 hypothetical protein B0J16DRAFT_273842 [Fusarium flagelliforme]